MDKQPPEGEQEDISVHGPLDPSFPLPQELVDLIIDMISDDRLQPRRGPKTSTLATLRAFSLVGKGWTARAQQALFQWAELHDTTSLYSFAEALRASPHLSTHVRRLTLLRPVRDGTSLRPRYSPDCVEVLFPTVLAGLLPNLRYLVFDELPGPPASSGVRASLQAVDGEPLDIVSDVSRRFRPYVPIHPRFPHLLSSGFCDLKELHLSAIVFQTFNDFARTLDTFKNLRVLYCGDVDWVTAGVLLPSFMTTTPISRGNREFLPVLQDLTVSGFSKWYLMCLSFNALPQVVTMGQHGPERLLSGLAPTVSLRALTVYLPTMGTLYHTGASGALIIFYPCFLS